KRPIWFDKKRDADAGALQAGNGRGQGGGCRLKVQAALGRQLLSFLRDQARPGGFDALGDRNDLRRRRHLQIERYGKGPSQKENILVLDVAAILAQVDGDPVRAAINGGERRLKEIRKSFLAGLAEGGDVVDVDAKSRHSANAPPCARTSRFPRRTIRFSNGPG